MNKVLHGLMVVAFGMLALSGAGAAAQGLYGLALPFIVTGLAGGAGAALLMTTVVPQRTIRLGMAAGAVVALVAGIALAPEGLDRGFVIGVAALLAVVLAFFALTAGGRPRRTADGGR